MHSIAVQSAVLARSPPPFARVRPRVTGAKARGIRFERAAQHYLEARSDWYLASPWLLFISADRPCWCQPDGIHLDVRAGVVTVVEIKYAHTARAHYQLRGVYGPVLRVMFPDPLWTFRFVELVRWFDPDTAFPETIMMCEDPFGHQSERIGVHVWKP